jgi:carbonic anhydrase/acetyltransferase-like protein (isoleucine patch superfamily)
MNNNEKQAPKIPTPEELQAMMVVPAFLVTLGVFVLHVLIYGLPALAVVLPFMYSPALWFTLVWVVCAPVVYAFLYGVVAGVLSRLFQAGIIKGVFPRDTRFPVYALRRLYGTCWTAVYYFHPIYNIILSTPVFKAIVFRLFGYKGSLNANIPPDAWIRDLPLLRIEEGAYVGNKVTLGTNVCLLGGNIIIGNVTLKKGAMVGHRTNIAIGVTIGERSELGVACIVGFHAKIGNDTHIGSSSGISHGAKIGNNVYIDVRSFIGTKAVIGDNLTLPSDISIPDGAVVNTMEDVMKYTKYKEVKATI